MSVDTNATAARVRANGVTPAERAAKPTSTPEPPRLPGRRNPKWIALGVVALCLGGLLAYGIYARLVTETSVVTATRTVYRGEVIADTDLQTLTLQGSSVPDAVPAARRAELVGKRAGYDLPEGSVVLNRAVADGALPAAGRSVVGLKVAIGRAPQALLLPGSPVRLVALPPTSGAEAGDTLTGKTYPARIVDTAAGPDGTSLVVNVDVTSTQAATIARLGAEDRVAVVRDAGR